MKRLLFSAAMAQTLLFLSLPALAQTSMFMSISWVAPTTTTSASGSQPLTGANAITAYKIYAATSPLTAAAATPTTTAPAGQTSAGATVMALPVPDGLCICDGVQRGGMLSIIIGRDQDCAGRSSDSDSQYADGRNHCGVGAGD